MLVGEREGEVVRDSEEERARTVEGREQKEGVIENWGEGRRERWTQCEGKGERIQPNIIER